MKLLFKLFFLYQSIIIGQTPDQIKKASDFIKSTGMTESQVKKAAKERGYSAEQIDSAIEKGKNLNIQVNSTENPSSDVKPLLESESIKDFEESSNTNETDQFLEGKESELNMSQKDNKYIKNPSYFGYDIFSKDPTLFQSSSSGFVDPSYLIGPKDEIIVMLWGETQFRQVMKVDREGFVFIPEIGQVFVNGLNLTMLESKLFKVFSQSYESLNPVGGAPTTFLDVSLGNLRPLRVQVLGEVTQPGAYTLNPSATLFSALYYFNGPKYSGTLRDIQLIRDGEKIASIDFYDFLLTGKKPNDLKLQLDDVIFIPPRLKTVSISGAINRKGIFELKPDETLIDLIQTAGGLKSSAYLNRAQVDRIVPYDQREKLSMDRMFKDVNLTDILSLEKKFFLQDMDNIKIFSILDNRQNVVDIDGSVTRPGRYELSAPTRLSELVEKSDGLLGDAFLERADVFRKKPDNSEELIKINLKLAIEKDPYNDIFLQEGDRVRVYGTTEMVSQRYVSIYGHIKNPGQYLLQDNMKLNDLIFMAGGYVDEEFKKLAYLGRGDLLRLNKDGITTQKISFDLRKVLESPNSEHDYNLKAFDEIILYDKEIFLSKKPVSIRGVVRNPGNYWLHDNMSLKDLILQAGGIKESVYRYRVEIARVDPFNKYLDNYAELFTLDIDDKFSINPEKSKKAINISSGGIDKFYLKEYDLITVRPHPNFSKQKIVTISGQVPFPGEYVILKSDEKISDIIERAGGVLPNGNLEASRFIRDKREINISFEKILKRKNSELNFNVNPGDQIIIKPFTQIVTLTGEVNVQGGTQFIPGKRLRYYLDIAGGLTPDADKSNIYVEYSNGISKRYKKRLFFSPQVKDGSVINVGKKKEEEPFDITEYAKELSVIISNLAQAVILVLLSNR